LKESSSKDFALFVLRLAGLGLAFAHGWPKIARFIAGEGGAFIAGVERLGFPFPVVFAWAAGLSELIGGFAIALGLFTRLSAAFAGSRFSSPLSFVTVCYSRPSFSSVS
jgi:putative oxidoreductase